MQFNMQLDETIRMISNASRTPAWKGLKRECGSEASRAQLSSCSPRPTSFRCDVLLEILNPNVPGKVNEQLPTTVTALPLAPRPFYRNEFTKERRAPSSLLLEFERSRLFNPLKPFGDPAMGLAMARSKLLLTFEPTIPLSDSTERPRIFSAIGSEQDPLYCLRPCRRIVACRASTL